VVVLLDAVDDSLAGGEVDHALAADGVGDGAALSRVLAFGLDGYRIVAKGVEVALGIGLLEELAALGGGSDGIEDAGVGDPRFGVVRNELISVSGDANARITRWNRHKSLSVSLVLHRLLPCLGAGFEGRSRRTSVQADLVRSDAPFNRFIGVLPALVRCPCKCKGRMERWETQGEGASHEKRPIDQYALVSETKSRILV
jgi:hypothetical protein